MRFPRLVPLMISGAWFFFGQSAKAEDWPGWRGPRGDGTSLEKQVPVQWNATTSHGLLWKAAIPGDGHSSPIVSGDRIFISTAVLETQDRVLLCLDRETGRERWRRTVLQAPLERKHRENSYASSTPATDGGRVFVSFLEGFDAIVAAYDFEGRQQWLARPGQFKSVHGFSSSPVVFEDKVIINGDHDGEAWIAALSRKDGATLWKSTAKTRRAAMARRSSASLPDARR